jgi:hypothetical protein
MAATADVDGSSILRLTRQRLGDYTSLIITNQAGTLTALALWTDPRNASACAMVDDYRISVSSGQTPAPPDPDVAGQCPSGFGNTDIMAAAITLN